MQGPFRISFIDAFPLGCGVVSVVAPLNDFNRSTRENPVQERDKVTGQLMWQVDVMDFDMEAKERTHRVKIIADHQPVPPEQIAGAPVRPVVLEGLMVTPYVVQAPPPEKNEKPKRAKQAYSLRCTGLADPKQQQSASKAG